MNKTKQKIRVFCSECKWFDPPIRMYGCQLGESCNHESNFTDNWKSKNATHKKHPSEINKQNDCKHFEQKAEERKSRGNRWFPFWCKYE